MAIPLHNLDTATPEEYDWGWIRWLMSDQIESGSAATVGIVQINPGKSNPLHYHPNCEELLYMTAGKCEHRYGEETVTMKAGDMIRVPQDVLHRARSVGDEPMQAVIVFSSGTRKTVMVDEDGV